MDVDQDLLGPSVCWRVSPELWRRFEDSRLRQLKTLPRWHPVPVWQADDDAFFSLIGLPDGEGVFLYGGMLLLVNRIAVPSPKRGFLVYMDRGSLRPHDVRTLASRCHCDVAVMDRIVKGGLSAAWLETCEWPLVEAEDGAAQGAGPAGPGAKVSLTVLDKALVAICGKPFFDLDRATKTKVEQYITQYNEDMVIDAIAAALKKQGRDRTLANALASIGWKEGDRRKQAAGEDPDVKRVEFVEY